MSTLACPPLATIHEESGQRAHRPLLDAESRSWVERLHSGEPTRGAAVAELYDRLRREAAFHIRYRITNVARFPRSDIDDLAAQAAGDALVALLRKLDDYRGDSQFWTWARRFAELEAPVSIRRRLGRDRVGICRHPGLLDQVVDPSQSAHDRAEARELLQDVSDVVSGELTDRQRTVLVAAVNGVPASAVAAELGTTPGAIYKCLHDARVKVRNMADVR
jgi:RNA polymerase sigma-70 factor (ECF subfamily)